MIKLKTLIREALDDVEIVKKLKELGFEYKGGDTYPHTSYNMAKAPVDGIRKQVLVYPHSRKMYYYAFTVRDDVFHFLRKVEVSFDDAEKFFAGLM